MGAAAAWVGLLFWAFVMRLCVYTASADLLCPAEQVLRAV
jgi:hypothetical protein